MYTAQWQWYFNSNVLFIITGNGQFRNITFIFFGSIHMNHDRTWYWFLAEKENGEKNNENRTKKRDWERKWDREWWKKNAVFFSLVRYTKFPPVLPLSCSVCFEFVCAQTSFCLHVFLCVQMGVRSRSRLLASCVCACINLNNDLNCENLSCWCATVTI